MKLLAAFCMVATCYGQQLDLSSLDSLASQAEQSANVVLDENKIRLAGEFSSKDEPGTATAKGILNGLKGVYVRSFEFNKPVDSMGALEPVRKQLRGPGWSNIVTVKERDGTAEVYFYSAGGAELGGLAVIAAEKRELTVVNIVGPVDLNALMKLRGTLGIPNLPLNKLGAGGNSSPPTPPKPPVPGNDRKEEE